ncbi:AAA family ATPase [Methanocaldococcus jannaschii]|nr:AAA family ATPase [Methanocaldococcus jannaschii]
MKIKSIAAKNLLSFDDFKITFEDGDVVTIFGPNNVGKTNLFRVLKLLRNIINEKISAVDLEIYLHNKNLKAAKIEVDVIFDKSDKEVIAKFLKIFFKINAPDLIRLCNNLKLNIINSIIDYFSAGSYIWECSELRCYRPYFMLRLRSLEEDIEKIKIYLKERELSEITPDLIDHSKVIHELDRNVEIIEVTNDLKNIITSSVNALITIYEKNEKLFFSTLIDGKENITTRIGDGNIENIVEISMKDFTKDIEKYEDCFKRLTMDKNILRAFVVLLALDKLLANKMSIYVKKVLEYSKENPWDKEIIEDLKYIVRFCGFDYRDIYEISDISLNDILLKIYENSLIFYEDYLPNEGKVMIPDYMIVELLAGLKNNSLEKNVKSKILELFKTSTTKDDLYLGILSMPSEKWIPSYLFYLKNNANLKLRKRYMKIKEMFEYIFNSGSLSFDVILANNKPDIVVYSEDIEIPLNMVGLGVKKILEILTLVFGYESKVILLDTPFNQLYPKYQKRFSKILKDTENIDSQVFIILHSPYFINNENIFNTFRFYKPKKSTKYICIGSIIKDLEKTFGTVILDRTTRKILLSDAVILLSSALRDIPLFDLAEYEDIPIDEYNIEVIRPQNTLSFGKYYALLQYTSIPYILMLRSWILYNLYEEIKDGEGKVRYKLLEKGKYHKIVEERLNFFKNRHPFWISKEEFDKVINIYIKTLEAHREKLIELGYIYLSSKEEVVKYCIEPLRKQLEDILRKKLFIFTVPTDFIIEPQDLKNIQIEKDKYIVHNYIGYRKDVLKEFKEFFDYFVKFHNLQ